jgi:hypothetical protein
MVDRLEGCGLLFQIGDQPGRVDLRETRDVIDRLFRIERRTLPANVTECIDDMAFHLHHAAFEHRKQPDRPGPDNRDIRLVSGNAHAVSSKAENPNASDGGSASDLQDRPCPLLPAGHPGTMRSIGNPGPRRVSQGDPG